MSRADPTTLDLVRIMREAAQDRSVPQFVLATLLLKAAAEIERLAELSFPPPSVTARRRTRLES